MHVCMHTALLVVILVVKVVLYVGVAAVTLEMTRADNELATLAYAASIFIAAIVWACLVTNAVCIVAWAIQHGENRQWRRTCYQLRTPHFP